jgi:hypothetical protein
MKINIGKYFSPPININKLENWYLSIRNKNCLYNWFLSIRNKNCLFDYTFIDKIVFSIIDKLHFFARPINNWCEDRFNRKIKIKIDDYDIWNLDHTLALIIYPAMIKLKSQKCGISHVDYVEDVPENIRDDPEKSWEYVLDEIIYSFGCMCDESFDMFDEVSYNRVRNGVRLFGKYYFSFWD